MKDEKPRCVSCGKYCGYRADNGTIYGCKNYEDPEPYDPWYWCKKHAHEKYKRALAEGKNMYIYWMIPNWQTKALKKLKLHVTYEYGIPRVENI